MLKSATEITLLELRPLDDVPTANGPEHDVENRDSHSHPNEQSIEYNINHENRACTETEDGVNVDHDCLHKQRVS